MIRLIINIIIFITMYIVYAIVRSEDCNDASTAVVGFVCSLIFGVFLSLIFYVLGEI